MIPQMLQNVLSNLMSEPATRPFPQVQREPFTQARGTVSFQIDNCVFCGLCATKCPAAAIEVTRAERKLLFKPFSCILCGACVEACKKDSVHIAPQTRAPVSTKPVETHQGAALPPKAPPAEPAA